MEYADYLARLTADSASLGELLAAYDLTAPVRSCPGWSLADLGYHVAELYQHKTAALRTSRRPDPWPPEPTPELWQRPIPEFFTRSAADLLAELANRDPTQPCWTWLPEDQTVGFWARRMTQETVIHLWDAQDALGQAARIDDRFAADGIDELLTAFLAGDWSDDPQPGPYGTVEIQTAVDRWQVQLDPDTVIVYRHEADAPRDAAADAVITETGPEMLTALWGRRFLPPVKAGGQALVDALEARLAMVTQ